MTRSEIVRATYDVAERLNDIKRRYGLIDQQTFEGVASRLTVARGLLAANAAGGEHVNRVAAELASHGTMFGDDELKWPVGHRFRLGWMLLAGLGAGLATEIGHTLARLAERYDVAPYRLKAIARETSG